ncbi:hypothetical protein SAMN05661096_00946 [Marivirga sericea]|uniref:Outer membrane protein beta-barrel domain-containing protein n=1 Tax=Marivirga sericea TaxID=1028 RepID=A0A1X7IQW0_9BACT|nr:hypothetical protein [Marivirga sericea]SMG17352.1 hypothetical protein SAMN05661096_00946 [Marivirga sericea]
MKYTISIVLFSILTTFNLYSQNQYTKEFLVTESKDTIYGFISNTSKVIHIEQGLYLKPDKNSKAIFYRIQDISSYRDLQGNLYYKRLLPDANKVNDYKLLEVLFTGNLNLYRFGGNFFLEKNDKLFKLINTTSYRKNEEGKILQKFNREYISILSVLMSECFSLYDKIIETDLAYRELVKLLEEYHICRDYKYDVVVQRTDFDGKISYGVFLGGFTSTAFTKFITAPGNALTREIELNDYNFAFGVDFNFRLREIHNYYLILSPQYSIGNEYSYEFTSLGTNDNQYLSNYFYNFNQFDFRIGFGKVFKKQKIQPFLNIGVVLSYFSNGYYFLDLDRRRTGTDEVRAFDDFFEFEGSTDLNDSLGIWTSFGINFNLFDDFIFYNRMNIQMSRFENETGRIRNFGRNFNYRQIKFDIGILL